MSFKTNCGPCIGRGYYGIDSKDICRICGGMGELRLADEPSDYKSCGPCSGRGYFGIDSKDTCTVCRGLGRVRLADGNIKGREEPGNILPTVATSLLGVYADSFSPEMRERVEKMAYIYGIFYCFENLVRELVLHRLAERKGPGWWDSSVPENVKKRVAQKRDDIEKNKWHEAVYQSNIDLTLFGDLAVIIIREWSAFDDLFPGQPWVKQRLDELERSRNVIAHGNLLPDAEIQRIEQYLKDWLRQVS